MLRQIQRLAVRAPFPIPHSGSTFCRRTLSSAQKKQPPVRTEWHSDGQIARVILNDSRRNALSLGLMGLLHQELREIDAKQEARAVILAAEGPAFSAGHELKELTSANGTVQHRKVFGRCVELLEFIQQMQLPVIAEVDGAVAAAGTQLVSSCDIVVASERCHFSVPGLKLGLFCSTPGIPLVRNVPRKLAMDMLLTARAIDANEALRAGLVSRVVPVRDIQAESLRVAKSICGMSRSVIALGKAFFYAQVEQNLHSANRQGAAVMCENLKLSDAQEGIDAFLGKRSPQWRHTAEKAIKE